MRTFCAVALLLLSSAMFAGDAEKPAPVIPAVPATTVSPFQLIVKGDEVFATIAINIADLQKAKKAGTTTDATGKAVKVTDEMFKQEIVRRIVQQVTNSYNVLLQTDADIEKRGKEAKEKVDKDIEEAKKFRPRILIED